MNELVPLAVEITAIAQPGTVVRGRAKTASMAAELLELRAPRSGKPVARCFLDVVRDLVNYPITQTFGVFLLDKPPFSK